MSQPLHATIGNVDFKRYIDELEEEMKKVLAEVGPGKNQGQIDAGQARIQELLRKQAMEVAKRMQVSGSYVFVSMLGMSMLTTAWISFALKRGEIDMSRSFDDRIALTEMLDSLELALSKAIAAGSDAAEMYKK